MEKLKFSLIIPTYNGAPFISKTLRSVLDQTYTNFEVMIVDDGSQDNTIEIVKQFSDPRIKLLIHEQNQGSNAARLTGIENSSGEVIALLDQDDLFHPDKLRLHRDYIESQPDVGLTYNARFEFNYSSETIRDIWRSPRQITLADLVMRFPIAPSDAVIRREWVNSLKLHDRSLGWTGGEIVWFGNLYFEGCKFGCVDRALNYRRHHTGRSIDDLIGGCELEVAAQDRIFTDQRCPPEVLAIAPIAHSNMYMFWAYRAFAQEETSIGQELITRAVRENPAILMGQPCELISHFIENSDDDENIEHAPLLTNILSQLPSGLSWLEDECEWGIARGYLRRATRAIMWDRPEDGKRLFEKAVNHNAKLDGDFLNQLTKQLVDYANEFGEKKAIQVLNLWSPYLEKLGGNSFVRRLKGAFFINAAFENIEIRRRDQVTRQVFQGMIHDPGYIFNKGVWSIGIRSLF